MTGRAQPAGIASEFLMTVRLDVAMDHLRDLGQTPAGHRRLGFIEGGSFQGPRLAGIIAPGGNNWIIVRADGVTRFDLRVVLKTDDGALIGMTYLGLRHGPADEIARMMRGELIDAARVYMRAAPFFETAAPKYAWLNSVVTIGIGDRLPECSRYHIHQVL
ncbi:MAG: DUF3237 domain-containing protein [Alphaproteobacteria bacterium]|nr:DUF3237 domain-containing protein [Alphaproteobacteria bacterium]